jgi:hypothetical protein
MTLTSTHDSLPYTRPEQQWRPADFLPLATASKNRESGTAKQARSIAPLEHSAPIDRLRGHATVQARPLDETTEDALFLHVVQADSNREMDWLWLATKVSSNAQRRYALERALRINPRSAVAKRGLARLRHQPEQPPDEPSVHSRRKRWWMPISRLLGRHGHDRRS